MMRSKISYLICLLLLFINLAVDAKKHARKKRDSIELAFNAHNNFGKTHFIVGFPQNQLEEEKQKNKTDDNASATCNEPFNLFCDGHVKQVFFSPDDRIQKVLIHLINNEKNSIKVAIYSFTDGDVAQALIDAARRGVKVEVVADPGCLQDKFNKINMLKDKGCEIFIYDPLYIKSNKNSLITSLMHNKFLLFGENILSRSIVWTGSFNLTKSAHLRNQENVMISDDTFFMDKYIKQFEILKTRSITKSKRKIKEESKIQLSKKGTIFESAFA